MAEWPLSASTAARAYSLRRWCQTGRYVHVAAPAAAALLASLTRYEGWVLSVVVMLIVAYDAWRRSADPIAGRELARAGGSAWRRWRRWWPRVQAAEANAIFYGCLAMSGIAGWVGWNAGIFPAPRYFQPSQFSRPSPQ